MIRTAQRQHCHSHVILVALALAMISLIAVAATAQPTVINTSASAPSSLQYEQLDERIDRIELVGWIVVVFLGLGLSGTVTLYLSLKTWAKKYTRKALRKELHRDSKVIAQLIDERSGDNRIKRETRIAVISGNRQLASVLQDHGFRKLQRLDPTEVTNHNLDTFGAIVFDLDGALTHQEAADLLEVQGIENALGYSPVHNPKSPLAGRCTFANSHITLYWRLLELFKYWEAATPRREGG